MNRREFHKRVAVSSVSAFALGRNAFAQGQKLRYCVVGLGRISVDHFMPGCKQSEQSQVTGFVTGHRDKAEKHLSDYGVPKGSIYSYENFEEIAKNKEIDAVYIGLPNSMHAEYTIRAAKAGKHVLCEKPMATSVKDSEAMIEACRSAGKKLMIAYRCHYEPVTKQAIKMIRDGKLGTIQAIESANGFNIKAGEWRLDGKLAGGGPLMDVGIYSLNAARYLTGEEPKSFKAICNVIDKDGRFKDVEENCSWTMEFPSGVVASCNTTYGANMDGFVRVHGTKGSMHLQPAFAYEGIHLKAELKGDEMVEQESPVKDPGQFATQADYFAQCVFAGKEPETNGDEGLRDMRYMAEIYRSGGRKLT